MDGPFNDPVTDPAPWYDSRVEESGDFLGVWLSTLDLQPVMARSSDPRVMGGAILGVLNLGKRVISCKGLMLAHSPSGMAFGERWLNAALAGTLCQDGCRGDDAEVLPACPDTDDYADYNRFYRGLIDVGVVDGPTFSQVNDTIPDCAMQAVDFQLIAGSPYLFGPKLTVLDHHVLAAGATFSAMVSTTEWPGDGVVVITIENDSGSITSGSMNISGHTSLDGTCNNLKGQPCWELGIGPLNPGEALIIDAHREELLLYKPTEKLLYPGLSKVTTPSSMFFEWPVVGPCADVCYTFLSSWATDAKISLDFYPRTW